MQMLDRENIEDDIPVVSDQQVSFIYVPNRRMVVSICEEVGSESDFNLLRETLVNGVSTCNHQSSDATMLLAVLADKILDDAFPFAEEMGDYLELLSHAMIQKPGTEYSTAADKIRMQLWRMRRFALRWGPARPGGIARLFPPVQPAQPEWKKARVESAVAFSHSSYPVTKSLTLNPTLLNPVIKQETLDLRHYTLGSPIPNLKP